MEYTIIIIIPGENRQDIGVFFFLFSLLEQDGGIGRLYWRELYQKKNIINLYIFND